MTAIAVAIATEDAGALDAIAKEAAKVLGGPTAPTYRFKQEGASNYGEEWGFLSSVDPCPPRNKGTEWTRHLIARLDYCLRERDPEGAIVSTLDDLVFSSFRETWFTRRIAEFSADIDGPAHKTGEQFLRAALAWDTDQVIEPLRFELAKHLAEGEATGRSVLNLFLRTCGLESDERKSFLKNT